jgi:hypothetical protein
VYVQRHLLQGLPKDKWVPLLITLSARTSAGMVQDQVGRQGQQDQHCLSCHASPRI